jgi:hypothetical protein
MNVFQMPRGGGFGQQRGLHPTIAVITSQYFEKVAVDAVMSNKQTFVRYATVGKTRGKDCNARVSTKHHADTLTRVSTTKKT